MSTPSNPQYRLESRGEGRFALSGSLNLATARHAVDAGERAFGDLRRIEIDLSGVEAVDSAGLAVLLEWVRWARLQGRCLAYRDPPDGLEAIAKISEVDGILRAAEAPPPRP
jgi:phospholipid transport system transporter-binding protein